MKKILVPTDFSANADKALEFAVQIARKAKATIVLVHACDLLELTFKDNLGLKKEYNRNLVKDAKEKLALYKDSIKETENVKVHVRLYKGLITDTILYAAKAHAADMIIMGTLGNASVKEKILGSKTAHVISKTNIPVLAVPLLSEWAVPSNILLAINNFNEGREPVVRPVLELAALFKAAVTVARFSAARSIAPHKLVTMERSGKNYARKLQSFSPQPGISFIQLDGSRFEKVMEKYITANHIDMIAMITHKRNFVKSIFRRSLAKKMSYHTSVPLLAIPL